MTNAKEELLEHIAGRPVKWIHIRRGNEWYEDAETISGTLEDCLPRLGFSYDAGYGGQEVFGHIWYQDGTWSERGEYDGSEWWEHKVCPPIPQQDPNTP